MKKKIILTSVIILVVLLVCFAAIYTFMLAFCRNTEDYSEAILGKWTCIQYYTNNQMSVCEEDLLNLEISPNRMLYSGNVLKENFSGEYKITGGKVCKLIQDSTGDNLTIYVEFNSRGHLKINIKEPNIILVLKQQEEQ